MEKCFKTHGIILENSDELVALKHGLLGKSLYFYTIASIHGIPHYKEYASMLMQYIIDKTNINMPPLYTETLPFRQWENTSMRTHRSAIRSGRSNGHRSKA